MFKKLLLATTLLLLGGSAWAQNPTCPTRPVGDNSSACASTAFVTTAVGAGTPTLPQNQIFVGNASNQATAQPMSGDCAIVASGAITCTKTNSVAFAASATTDATNASNISSGTLPFGRFPSGADSGNISAQTGNFTVQTTDCGKTFTFTSTSQATVTVAAGVNFAANCRFWLANIGSYTGVGSARGLVLSGIAGVTFPAYLHTLQPGQITEFINVGPSSAWVETGFAWRQRWKPSVSVTVFSDAAGSDTANDCLASGTTNACGTASNGLNVLYNAVDLSGGAAQSTLSLNGTFAINDILHIAGSAPGGAGNAALTITGGTINGGANPCIATFDHATVEINGVTCTGTGGCFSAASGSFMGFIGSVSTCNATGALGVSCSDPGSKIEFINVGLNTGASHTSAQALFFANGNCMIAFDGAFAVSFGANVTYSLDTVFVEQLSTIAFGAAFVLNAHTVTGTRYDCNYFANLFGTSAAPNTFIPGSVNGSNGTGGCNTP